MKKPLRSILIGLGALFAGLVVLLVLNPRRSPTPGVASEADLVALVEAERTTLQFLNPDPTEIPGLRVVELPRRDAVPFFTSRPEIVWFSRGGRFSPTGVFTAPNADVPFLFPAQEGGHYPFAIQAPPAKGIRPVPNAVDLPPVVLTRGEDRTVWTRTLERSGDRYPLPPEIGASGLAIGAADAPPNEPAPRFGLLAPATLPADGVGTNGVLLGRSTLHRLRMPERPSGLRFGPLNRGLLWLGIRPNPTFGMEEIRTWDVHYEIRTMYHVYKRSATGWRYAATRMRTASSHATEGPDASAFGPGIRPWIPTALQVEDVPFERGDRPGGTFLPFRP